MNIRDYLNRFNIVLVYTCIHGETILETESERKVDMATCRSKFRF